MALLASLALWQPGWLPDFNDDDHCQPWPTNQKTIRSRGSHCSAHIVFMAHYHSPKFGNFFILYIHV